MKRYHEGFCHKKSGIPAKRSIFASLSAFLGRFKMMQRNTQHQRSNPQAGRPVTGSRTSHDSAPTITGVSDNPFHSQVYMQPSASLPPSAHQHSEGSEDWFAPRQSTGQWDPFLNHTNDHRTDLASLPKPRRVTSVSLPFATPQASYPVQARHQSSRVPRSIKPSTMTLYHQVVGDPALKIFRVRLPPHLLHLLDGIVLGCEAHASTLRNSWLTELYSLTKQDLALRRIPHLFDTAKPITSYIKRSMMALLGAQSIKMDKNQPHVLKYSAEEGHVGVE